MSLVAFIIYVVVLAAGCAGSWKGALYWHNRTRGPQHEDPRDQEIRELAAALSVSRKAVETHGLEKKQQEKQAWELTEKLKKTSDAFSNMQQKFNATKESLNKEIEGKSEFEEEMVQLRRDNEDANSRIDELEIQARAGQHGGMVAELDMLDEGEHALATALQEIDQLRIDVDKWKQHCTVMSSTNKTLRAQVAELNPANRTSAPLEAIAAHDNVVADKIEATDAHPDEFNDAEELTDSVPALRTEVIADDQADTAPADPDDSNSLQRDDLQSIRGVGSKLEQKLNLLGIFSYKEILALETNDFERANLVIPNLQSRIERDAWQDQARALHLEKYNEVL